MPAPDGRGQGNRRTRRTREPPLSPGTRRNVRAPLPRFPGRWPTPDVRRAGREKLGAVRAHWVGRWVCESGQVLAGLGRNVSSISRGRVVSTQPWAW